MSTRISISTTITQADIDSYTFPVTIEGGTLENPVIITFDENLIIRSTIGINGFFIIGSEYITVNGESNTVTITDIPDYPGLIQNGTDILNAQTNITIKNIGVLSSNTTTLAEDSGWLCQRYFGKGLSTGTLLITNCNSTGNISGSATGGICGRFYGSNASGDAELIIENCYSTGIISGGSSGGICGNRYGSRASGGIFTISNCYSTGIINGQYCGGICGNRYGVQASNGTFTILNCYSTGNIDGNLSGGICGQSYGEAASGGTFAITTCYSIGSINGGSNGGICGTSLGSSATAGTFQINNCYSLGNISSNSGGIVGPNSGINASETIIINVNNCYTIGTFTNSNGIFGPNNVIGTETNCIASGNNKWSDNDGISTIFVDQPITWLNFDIDIPWLLESNNAVLMNISSELNSDTTSFNVTFNSNQPTTNFELDDITVTNGNLTDFSTITSTTYSATFTPNGIGITYTIQVKANKYTNSIGTFNQASNILSSYLATTISTSTTITQTLLNTYTFPVTINGGTLGSPVIISFVEDLTISSISGYFIIGSDYITLDGQSNTITITTIPDYLGLIQNGTSSSDGYTNITVKNIGLLSSDTTTLANNGGWLCQRYYGKSISTGTLSITNCYSTGAISGSSSGGICGDSYGSNASGDAEFKIENCYSKGSMIGDNGGGICGGAYASIANGGIFSIKNCYSTGIISGIYNGGICGTTLCNFALGGTFIIINCYSTGAISGEECGGIGSDYYGYLSSNIIININNCYSLGNISSTSGGIVGPYCGIESTNLTVNVNNCYTIGTFDTIIDNGIFGPDKVVGTQTNCIASGNNTWLDNNATLTIFVNQPNTWINTNINLPWLLESNNAVLMSITSELVSPKNTSLKLTFNSNWITTNFEINDITVTNGKISDFNTIDNATYNAIFTPTNLTIPYTIQVEANKYTNINNISNQASNILSGFLTSVINKSTIITQANIDSYTFPIIINGGTVENPVIISFGEDLTIGSSIGTSGYFIIGSEYITVNGESYTVTITDIQDYPGLIQNGTSSSNAYTNITIENIGILSSGSTTLGSQGGWLCQIYFGKGLSTGTLLITNCYSNGIINGFTGGGICGRFYGNIASGDAELKIENCYSTGEISADAGGGICGNRYGFQATGGIFTIENCYSIGTISGIDSGGICGNKFGIEASDGTFIIQNCYSNGAINANFSGGISGSNCGEASIGTTTFTINNCYSIGNISTTSGGILGPNCGIRASETTTINVNNCYTIGTFTDDNGIFGPNKIKGTINNCIDSGANVWLDSDAISTIFVEQPNTWINFNLDIPWLLQSNNDVLMNITSELNSDNTSLNVTFNSNQPTTDFELDDITRMNGDLIDFSKITSTTYRATFIPNGLGIIYTIQVEADKYTNINGSFNQASNIISGYISTTLSTSTSITQTLLNTYTFPVAINGGTLENPIIISFDEDLTFSSINGTNKYFIIDSDYIIINGQNNTVTITDIEDYPGLIQNGTFFSDAYTNVTVENIGILNSDITTLLSEGGWLCQSYYGRGISTGTIIIQNCYSTGIISGNISGGICGGLFGFSASGDAELIIQNCYSIGNIIGDNDGGICGGQCGFDFSGGKIEIKNCYSTGEIQGRFNGGICGTELGYSASDGTFTIENCYSTGIISGEECGGIGPDAYGHFSSNIIININNCYSLGNISSTSGGILGPSCGIDSTNLILNVNNCYTIGTYSNVINNGIFGPNKVVGTQTNCLASGNNTWNDAISQTILTGTPISISTNNPGLAWTTIATNTPYVLSSYNAQLYEPNNAISSIPYTTTEGLFQPGYTYQLVYNNQIDNIATTSVFVYKGIAPSYYDYNFNTFTFTNKDSSNLLDLFVNPTEGIIYYYNKDIYNVYTITFSEFLESPSASSGASLYFTYKGESYDDSIIKYVAGSCSLQLVNQTNGIGKPLTWQWQTDILQNNIRASLTGTIYTNSGIFLTPAFLWNLMLNEQKKTLCNITLAKNTYKPVANILYAVGTTEIVSKLYLYITAK
jgi:hypothetical protein